MAEGQKWWHEFRSFLRANSNPTGEQVGEFVDKHPQAKEAFSIDRPEGVFSRRRFGIFTKERAPSETTTTNIGATAPTPATTSQTASTELGSKAVIFRNNQTTGSNPALTSKLNDANPFGQVVTKKSDQYTVVMATDPTILMDKGKEYFSLARQPGALKPAEILRRKIKEAKERNETEITIEARDLFPANKTEFIELVGKVHPETIDAFPAYIEITPAGRKKIEGLRNIGSNVELTKDDFNINEERIMELIGALGGNKQFKVNISTLESDKKQAGVNLGKELPKLFYTKLTKQIEKIAEEKFKDQGPKSKFEDYLAHNILAKSLNELKDDPDFSSLITDVLNNPDKYGFTTENLQKVQDMPIGVLLARNTMLTQQTRPILGRGYQIESGQHAITVSSITGMDFAKNKAVKDYFFTNDAFKEGKKEVLQESFEMILRQELDFCVDNNFTAISMLPRGLGVFLESVPKNEQNNVKRMYMEALAKIAAEEKYQNVKIYLNPAQMGFDMPKEVLKNYNAGAPIVIHDRDSKDVAIMLAEQGEKVLLQNASDAKVLLSRRMFGMYGNKTVTPMSGDFVGEELIASATTMQEADTDVLTNENRVTTELAKTTAPSPGNLSQPPEADETDLRTSRASSDASSLGEPLSARSSVSESPAPAAAEATPAASGPKDQQAPTTHSETLTSILREWDIFKDTSIRKTPQEQNDFLIEQSPEISKLTPQELQILSNYDKDIQSFLENDEEYSAKLKEPTSTIDLPEDDLLSVFSSTGSSDDPAIRGTPTGESTVNEDDLSVFLTTGSTDNPAIRRTSPSATAAGSQQSTAATASPPAKAAAAENAKPTAPSVEVLEKILAQDDPEQIAKQLMKISRELFMAMEPEEFVRSPKTERKEIEDYRINLSTKIIQILNAENDPTKKEAFIKTLLDITKKCDEKGDLQTTITIISALTAANIETKDIKDLDSAQALLDYQAYLQETNVAKKITERQYNETHTVTVPCIQVYNRAMEMAGGEKTNKAIVDQMYNIRHPKLSQLERKAVEFNKAYDRFEKLKGEYESAKGEIEKLLKENPQNEAGLKEAFIKLHNCAEQIYDLTLGRNSGDITSPGNSVKKLYDEIKDLNLPNTNKVQAVLAKAEEVSQKVEEKMKYENEFQQQHDNTISTFYDQISITNPNVTYKSPTDGRVISPIEVSLESNANKAKTRSYIAEDKKAGVFAYQTVGETTGKYKRQEDRVLFSSTPEFQGLNGRQIRSALKATFQDIQGKCSDDDVGSTLVTSIITGDTIYTAHVGDSVGYILYMADDGTISCERLNRRLHEPNEASERERLKQAGANVFEQREGSGDWRVGGLAVSRAIGDNDTTGVSHEPDIDICQIDRSRGRAFVLHGCDGLYEGLKYAQLSDADQEEYAKQVLKLSSEEDINKFKEEMKKIKGMSDTQYVQYLFNKHKGESPEQIVTSIATDVLSHGSGDNVSLVLTESKSGEAPKVCGVADGHGGQKVSEAIAVNFTDSLTNQAKLAAKNKNILEKMKDFFDRTAKEAKMTDSPDKIVANAKAAAHPHAAGDISATKEETKTKKSEQTPEQRLDHFIKRIDEILKSDDPNKGVIAAQKIKAHLGKGVFGHAHAYRKLFCENPEKLEELLKVGTEKNTGDSNNYNPVIVNAIQKSEIMFSSHWNGNESSRESISDNILATPHTPPPLKH